MSDNSMSVHSLIDKFSEPSPIPLPKPTHIPGINRRNLTPNSQSGIASLLGPNITTWPYSEEAFMSAVALRTEQEKTKQEYYKLELANKNLDILRSALEANIPTQLIPLIYAGSANPTEADNIIQQYQNQKQQLQPPVQIQMQQNLQTQEQYKFPPSPSQQNLQAPPQYQQQIPIQVQPYNPNMYNTNPASQLHYRYSSGNNKTLSPAKVGAAAVASLTLEKGRYPVSPTRSHQRHYSLPPQPSSIPERQSVEFKSPKKSGLQSHQGLISPIQVNPMPSQPPKNNQPPTQESMTSLQHVIQFHHWTPEESNSPSGSKSKNFEEKPAGKRRRSNSDLTDKTQSTSATVGELTRSTNKTEREDELRFSSGTATNTAPQSNTGKKKGHSRAQSEIIEGNKNDEFSNLNSLADAATSTKEKDDKKFPNNILSA